MKVTENPVRARKPLQSRHCSGEDVRFLLLNLFVGKWLVGLEPRPDHFPFHLLPKHADIKITLQWNVWRRMPLTSTWFSVVFLSECDGYLVVAVCWKEAEKEVVGSRFPSIANKEQSSATITVLEHAMGFAPPSTGDTPYLNMNISVLSRVGYPIFNV